MCKNPDVDLFMLLKQWCCKTIANACRGKQLIGDSATPVYIPSLPSQCPKYVEHRNKAIAASRLQRRYGAE